MKLSPYFWRSEFRCKGCTNESPCWRGGTDTADVELIDVLNGIRSHYQKPVIINSGHRCPEYNKRVGGARNSQHVYGRAADFVVQGVDPAEVYAWCDTWHKGGLGKYDTFTHIDTRNYKVRW